MSLPSGYKRLAYIQSSGTQFVNANFKPNNNTRVVAVFQTTRTSDSFFGAQEAWGTKSFSLGSNTCSFGAYGNTSLSYNDGKTHTYDFDKGVLKVDGTTILTASGTFQLSCNMYVLGNNEKDTTLYPSYSKLYFCQIYDNGTLVRDYVPCLNPSGVAGLYDLANGKFYGNAGTGTFIAGELIFLKYIQSSGTQYVDTGFKPNNNTRIVMKVQATDTSASSWVFGGRTSNTSATMGVFWYTNNSAWNADYNGSSQRYAFPPSVGALDVLNIDFNKNVLSINGTSNTFTAAIFQSTGTLALLALNTAGSVSTFAKARLYSCQVYDNGTLVRDYRPAQAGDEVGLWDAANEVFYPNAGTGVFTAGPVAQADTPENFEQVLAVYLRWSAVDCDGYRIYRNGVLLGETTQTHYIDLTAEDNEDYTYTLTAYKGSAESEPATLTVYTRSGYFVYKPLVQSAFFQ